MRQREGGGKRDAEKPDHRHHILASPRQVASFAQESLCVTPFLPAVCMFLFTFLTPFQCFSSYPSFYFWSNLGFLKFSLLTKIREDKKLHVPPPL